MHVPASKMMKAIDYLRTMPYKELERVLVDIQQNAVYVNNSKPMKLEKDLLVMVGDCGLGLMCGGVEVVYVRVHSFLCRNVAGHLSEIDMSYFVDYVNKFSRQTKIANL